MHLHTYIMLRCCTFSCTCTHTSCYAAVRSHALPDRRAGVRDGYGYVNDDDDGDDDDDDDEIAPDAKVSFFSVLWSPCKMFEK